MKYNFYDKQTGIFTSGTYSGMNVDACIPEGCEAIEGHFDHLSQRVDIATGKVVDYQPPQPSDDHEWNANTKRWIIKPEIVSARRDTENANNEIAALESSQHRCLREIALGDSSALERLKSIDSQIAIQRQIITLNMGK